MRQKTAHKNFIELLAIIILVFVVPTRGTVFAHKEDTALQSIVHQADSDEYESFFDIHVGEQLTANHVAGAAVALVKDGEIVFAKGYGDANIAEHVPVHADKTLFRIGSVTKLFTWTAVMQLVERGRLDLDADINTYIDFKIPDTYPEPITLRHLMSHTAGFEDRLFGLFVPTPEQLIPDSEWLPANLPARVRPAGTAASYSNYGAALAGYIVERASGMSYADYLDVNILEPLGMTRTSARQPLPPALELDLSHGYTYANDDYVSHAFEVTQTAQAGSMSSTATDMAAFMLAHLQYGRYGDNHILDEATARQMQSPLFQPDPSFGGFAYGFERIERAGEIILSHGGDTSYFHSKLILIPTDQLGLFVVYNSVNSSRLRADLVDALLDCYYPVTLEPPESPPGFEERAARFTGAYQSNRRSYTTADKLAALVSTAPVWTIRTDGESLILDDPWRKEQLHFIEVEPLLFQQADGVDRLAFREKDSGQIELAFLESQPSFALERLNWYQMPTFHLSVLGTALLLFLSLPLVGLVKFLRRSRSETVPSQPALARVASWIVSVSAGLNWFFLITLGFAAGRLMASLGADPVALQVMDRLRILPWLIALLAVAGVVLLGPVWYKRYWRLPGRIYYSLLASACVAFTWLLADWNLLAI